MMWLKGSSKPNKAADVKETSSTEGGDDRYAVDQAVSATEESALDTSAVSSDNSSYVSTGTSFESDDSAIDPDDLFDDDELDELMDLESNPIMGGWVDSACGWLDKPMCFMSFGKETSLLRQSKGRTKSALQQMRMNDTLSTVANMKMSAAERRNLRLHRKGLSTVDETDDVLSTNSSQFISPQRIQPLKNEVERKVKKTKKNYSEENKQSVSQAPSKNTDVMEKAGKLKQSETPAPVTLATDEKSQSELASKESQKERSLRMEKTFSRDPEGSHHSRLLHLDDSSDVELAKPQEELEDAELSQTLENALMDSPDPAKTTHQPNGDEAMNIPELELPESDSIHSGSEKSPDASSAGISAEKEESKNSSTRSERSAVKSVRKNKIMEVVQRSRSVPRTKDITDLTHMDSTPAPEDEQKFENKIEATPKPIEIIDVLSMDDNDSWTPGSASIDPEPSVSNRQFEYHGMEKPRARSKSRDPSPSLSRRNASRHARDPSPSQTGRKARSGTFNADDLWNEEEAKLSKKQIPKDISKHRATSLSSSQTVEDVWSQEEQKLQDTESIFDDPKAREAFLGHRRGRLQDTGSEHRSSSLSRRRRLVQALKGGEEENEADQSKRSTRSRSVDTRKAPAPEDETHSRNSRSKSRESRRPARIVPADQQDEVLDRRSAQARINRITDLVAIRTIEDGQRLRSHRNSNIEEPIDVHEYMERSVSRGRIGRRSPLRRSLSLRRSKSREVVDLAHLDDYKSRRSVSRTRDARDDHESRPESRSKPGASKSPKSASDWPDYETVASATKELRKLEKQIEKQLRQAKRDSKSSKEEWDSQTVSSKEIKMLEKQLAQKLKRDNEKRATKLKRIKRKVPKATNASLAMDEPLKSISPSKRIPDGACDDDAALTSASKSFSQKVDDFRERSKFDQLRSLRSARYLRSSSSRRGGRTGAGSPEDRD